jgi:hypothetical protein
MDRRAVIELLGLTAGGLALAPRAVFSDTFAQRARDEGGEVEKAFALLRGEAPCRAEVRVERGGPRLFINGRESYPFLALSAEVLKTAAAYRDSGIGMLAPIIGLNACWTGPGKYSWDAVDLFFARLLAVNPETRFLPRLHLNAPAWWKEAHPDELVKCGLTPDPAMYRQPERLGESGLNWNALADPNDASWASKHWRIAMTDVLRAFLKHMEASPLVSRMIGYQVAYGHTGEWHYTGCRFLPDYSEPMREAIGPLPEPQARLTTTGGLLRDPEREREVIAFYHRFHEFIADTLLHFARVTKEGTERRVLCGAFFTYLIENVHIQEAGHLAPEKVLASNNVDFIASPYTYQHTNMPSRERWESDMVDDAGNWLGRARGVGGDGAYRVVLESLHRHGKLFFVEMDPSTYIEPKKMGEGGSGHDSVEGSVRILRRDLGQMFARGVGGWFFDFGHLVPPFQANRGWYDDRPLIDAIRPFSVLGGQRMRLDISSVARAAAVYDPRAFFATAHWKAEEPWAGYGIAVSDHINHWFLNSQQRTFSRIGAPMDALYRFDLTADDARRYKLLFMVNLFTMEKGEVDRLLGYLEGSGCTVVWYYAPGFITPDRWDLEQMERLTGFRYSILRTAGPMQIRMEGSGEGRTTVLGTKKPQRPRFAVTTADAEILGRWVDTGAPAFVRRPYRGWTSVYVGAAPLTADVVRRLAVDAGVPLWSDRPDIVYATRDALTVIATARGERVLTLPRPLRPVEGGEASAMHRLTMEFGDVRVFLAPES